jgi:hypothetical protein
MATLRQYTVYSQWAEIAWNAETWHNMGMLFATLDTNGNGEIDKHDFENGRFFQKYGMFTGGQTWNKVQKHFRAFDTDGNQRISKTEFIEGMSNWALTYDLPMPPDLLTLQVWIAQLNSIVARVSSAKLKAIEQAMPSTYTPNYVTSKGTERQLFAFKFDSATLRLMASTFDRISGGESSISKGLEVSHKNWYHIASFDINGNDRITKFDFLDGVKNVVLSKAYNFKQVKAFSGNNINVSKLNKWIQDETSEIVDELLDGLFERCNRKTPPTPGPKKPVAPVIGFMDYSTPKFVPGLMTPPLPDSVKAEVVALPKNVRSFQFLFQYGEWHMAKKTMPALQTATGLFWLANNLRVQLEGGSSGGSLYNMACTNSLLAESVGSHHRNYAGYLGHSMNWLLQSLVAKSNNPSYKQKAWLNSDKDLAGLRAGNASGFFQATKLGAMKFA